MSAASERRLTSLSGHDPAGYVAHPLHATSRSYLETNCYTDILIELLHGCGYEPLAAFGHLVRMDFEGDQWTFFKPPPGDLEALYGIDIHEMQPYRPLPLQIAEQIARGRTIIVELDSWFMPDTAATTYRTEHVKTSIAADAIDPAGERLHYFHNAGLHALEGADYRGIFRIGADADQSLPPYTELVRFDAGDALGGEALRETAVALLRRHLERRPQTNPFTRFGVQLGEALPALLAGDLSDYHAYAFATVRMAGAAFEIAGDHAAWLFGADADPIRAAAGEIVDGCKALSFRLARRRAFDPGATVETLAAAWEHVIDDLTARTA